MNLINDLGSEIALAFLIEKRNSERISSADILPLIKRINDVLEPISHEAEDSKSLGATMIPAKNANTSSH